MNVLVSPIETESNFRRLGFVVETINSGLSFPRSFLEAKLVD